MSKESLLNINTPVDLSVICRIARSGAFSRMVAWALREGLDVRWEMATGLDDSPLIAAKDDKLWLLNWSKEYQEKQLKNETPLVVRAVSGEFNILSWNKVELEDWQVIADRLEEEKEQSRYKDFSVYALCAPYVAIGEESDDATKKRNNTMVDFLVDAHTKMNAQNMPFVNLYRSETRLPCHWVAIGNRISITDWHMPMAGKATNPLAYPTTVYAEGEGVAVFAEKAFAMTYRDVFDAAVNYQYEYDMLRAEEKEKLPIYYKPQINADSETLPVADRTKIKPLSDVIDDKDIDGFIPAGDGYFYADKGTINASYEKERTRVENESALSTVCRLI